jgi:hypothetical protein
MFFLEYEPQTRFQGKKLRLFRALAVLPVLYEVGALVLRITMIMTDLKPPYIVYPFLTTKPFMSFILFIILALHIKFDEYRFKKRDKRQEDFEEYIRTNDHSLRFSIFTSIMILITGLIDFLVYIISTVYLTYTATGTSLNADLSQEAIDEVIPVAMKVVGAWRFGEHCTMILLIPLILLFSYTRTHKDQMGDILIPVFGVALAVIVTIEGLYQCLLLQIPSLMNQLSSLMNTAM